MDDIHVLLVDDEEKLVQTMSVILEMEHYKVSRASDGYEALEVLEDGRANGNMPVDILVTDVQMPRMSGLPLLRELKARSFQIPTLVATGFGNKRLLVDAMREGAVDYIDKPFQMEALSARVGELADRVRENRKRHAEQEAETEKRVRTTYEERLAASHEFEVLGKLSSGIIHDFNNIITATQGYAEMLSAWFEENGDKGDCDRPRHYTDNILLSAETAAGTLRQLQAFSKPESSEFGPQDINEVVDEVVRMTRATIGHSTNVTTRLDAENAYVYGARPLLQNVFVNLLLNARDAMPDGGEITISTQVDSESPTGGDRPTLLVSVRDHGTGIPEDLTKRIFDPFFTTKGKNGNGLGLASVLSTVDKHGGSVEVDSAESVGTEFRLVFPLIGQNDDSTNSDKEENAPCHT